MGWVDAEQQASLAAGADSHVAVDQERETSEHPFLCHTGFGLNHFSNPVCEGGVICHGKSVPRVVTRGAGGLCQPSDMQVHAGAGDRHIGDEAEGVR